MKLKDLLRTESTVHEQYLAHNSNRIIEMFADAIKDENRCPHTVIIELNHLLSKNDEEWKKNVKKERIKVGRRGKRIMQQTIAKYSIDDYIKKQFNYYFSHHNGKYKRMDYSLTKFIDLSKMEVAMLLYKYDNDIMKFEVTIAIIELLINYFELSYIMCYLEEKREWCFSINDLYQCIEVILSTDTQDYLQYINYFSFNHKFVKHDWLFDFELEKKIKPQSKEELLSLKKEGMTETIFDNAIARYYNVSTTLARAWKSEFGLSRKYNRNKDNKADATPVSTEQTEVISNLEN